MAEEKLKDTGAYVPYAKKHLAQLRTARQDGLRHLIWSDLSDLTPEQFANAQALANAETVRIRAAVDG